MTTIINIGAGVRCTNLPQEAKEKIKIDLSFNNPVYMNAMKRGGYISADTLPKIALFDVDEADDIYWIPRGYLYWLLKFLRTIEHPFKIEDCSLLLKPLNLKFHGTLRDYQEIAEKQMLKYPVGVLEASTGSGKTVMAISIIASRKQPTLIIVHSKELLYQWRDQLEKFLHIECGLIGDGKFDIKPITVGIVNSVNNKLKLLTKHFGHVVCDETHRITASTWAETIQDFPAKYYLGLTATPFRSDGLGHAIFASIGPKLHKVDKKMLLDIGAVLKPEIFRVETDFYYMFTNDYSTMLSKLTKDVDRVKLVCAKIAQDIKTHHDNVLIVSDRKEHCKIMQETLENEYNIKGRVLTGSGRKKEREEIVKEVRAGKCKALFATTSLVGEGFDVPNLTSLFITTPIKFTGRLMQVVGRVLRPSPGKSPRVYDFRDNNISVLQYSGIGRDRLYRKEWQ